MIGKAAKTSALLSLLFVVVYGGINWLTSLRPNVPSCYFPWERQMPFLPWMIIPYMSIDLFYITSPFTCRDDRERRTLARRMTAAIGVAGVCFLLFPLRFAFVRPQVAGWLGTIFNNFRRLDQPFNQFPALHIALCLILAARYVRRFSGGMRAALLIWFGLIAVSTVTTYQHHMIDFVGGVALAVLCFHLIQDEPVKQECSRNRRVGVYYMIGALALSLAALAMRRWALFLFWPAMSLALVSAAYWGIGPGMFRKRLGRLPLTTWLIFWPVLLGQRVAKAHYAQQCQAWDRLTDQLWIGRQLSHAEAERAIAAGVTAVLDLTTEFSETRVFRHLAYHQLPMIDLTAPTPGQLDDAVAWIARHGQTGVVYVHCKAGYSRTAAVAGAFLLATGKAQSADAAIAMLRAARPSIVIRPEAEQSLRAYAIACAGQSGIAWQRRELSI